MKRYILDIRDRTADMTPAQKTEYIVTYYWYHILGICAAAAILIFLIVHFGFGGKEPYFNMVLINQPIDYGRDEEMEQAFLAYLGDYGGGPVDISSDYNFSYGEIKLEGVNESSYEKFFFRLGGGELDVVLMPESFYRHCLEMDVEFTDLSELETGDMRIFEDGGKQAAVYVEKTGLAGFLDNETDETLLLAFPSSGTHRQACQEFLRFLADME